MEHIGSFVFAFVSSTISMLYLINNQWAPAWTVVGGCGFGVNAVIGLSQLKKLDDKNVERIDNFNYFIF